MATLSEVTCSVRRLVSDYKPEPKYSDEYYFDAISFALSKLSYDFSATYDEVADVPTARVFLLTKLATIQMCYIRASEAVDIDYGEDELPPNLHSLKVPNLEVEGSTASPEELAQAWISLAQKLQAEYDGELDHTGGTANAATVQVCNLKRISMSTGGYRKYNLDEGLAAVTISAVASSTLVTLSWSILYDETFMAYEVYRDTSADMSSEVMIGYIADNHEVTHEDDTVVSGTTYYYRVKTVNPNNIKTNSNTLTVAVP